MRKKKRNSSTLWVVAVLLVIAFALHSFSWQPEAQRREKAVVQQEQAKEIGASWTTMPDSVVELCTAAPLTKTPEIVLQRTSYVVSYNKQTRCPNWVAWQLTADHTDGELKRMNNFHEDEDCPRPRATLQDYKGSGWSRGHMCPAGDNKWSREAMYDSFSLVNVCPQDSKHNSGVWNSIEMDCRQWARKYGEVFIVCGPVWTKGKHQTIGPNKVQVPEAFFKVVLRLKPKPAGFGFITRNNEGTKKRDLYYNSIDQVERITGIDFFPALPDDIENEVEAKADVSDWGLKN
jgi:endonuclease G